MRPYDYSTRKGIEEISWERFGELARVLTEKLAAHEINAVVGTARGGLFPATAVACMLRLEMFPVRVTRRVNDVVTHAKPLWKVDVSPEVAGKIVAVVDEMASSGDTLQMIADRVRERGAARVVTASLFAHTWANPMPDAVAHVSDALVILPWDHYAYQNGAWDVHPEYRHALALQGL